MTAVTNTTPNTCHIIREAAMKRHIVAQLQMSREEVRSYNPC